MRRNALLLCRSRHGGRGCQRSLRCRFDSSSCYRGPLPVASGASQRACGVEFEATGALPIAASIIADKCAISRPRQGFAATSLALALASGGGSRRSGSSTAGVRSRWARGGRHRFVPKIHWKLLLKTVTCDCPSDGRPAPGGSSSGSRRSTCPISSSCSVLRQACQPSIINRPCRLSYFLWRWYHCFGASTSTR